MSGLLTLGLFLLFAAYCLLPTAHWLHIPWTVGGRRFAGDGRPRVMGIVNVTPDSFSDGGASFGIEAAVARARRLVAEGADLVDVGGESSRPGSDPVPEAEELWRVAPAVEALAWSIAAPISVDTTKAAVARAALAAGAAIVNDVTALGGDPGMARVVADSGAGLVLMHMRGTPKTMQADPSYADVVREVYDFLAGRIEWAEARGIPRARIAIDPGIGFGKTAAHNLELLRNLGRFASLGCAVLVGTSRKGFLGALTGRAVSERTAASVASALAAVAAGASVVRVHDVAAVVDAFTVWEAQRGWGAPS